MTCRSSRPPQIKGFLIFQQSAPELELESLEMTLSQSQSQSAKLYKMMLLALFCSDHTASRIMLIASSCRVWQIGIVTAIASFLGFPVQVQAQIVEKLGIPLFEVADLIDRSYGALHGVIAVSGILRCSGQSTCWFEHPTNSKQHLEIDVSRVSSLDRERFRNCIAAPCGELLVGFVDRGKSGVRFSMLR